jgi:hypothetical protein
MGACTSTEKALDAMGAPTSKVEAPETCFTICFLPRKVKEKEKTSIQVFVKKPYSEVTYLDLKSAISKELGDFPVEKQRLIFCGEEKENKRLVIRDKVHEERCIYLLEKN